MREAFGKCRQKKIRNKKAAPRLRRTPVSLLRSALRDDLHATEAGGEGKQKDMESLSNQFKTNKKQEEIEIK